jgi:hypothetical protein
MSKDPRPYFTRDDLNSPVFLKMMLDSKDPRAVQRAHDYLYRPVEQLYQIETDPGCWQNLAGQAASQPVLRKIRTVLLEKLSATADPQLQLFRSLFPADKPEGKPVQ